MSNKPKEAGHESFDRMNYLYQAAEVTVKSKVRDLDRQLLRNMWSLSKKTVKKLDPSLKRTLCKGCGGLLQPGTTARVRVRSKRQKHVAWTCLACGYVRRFNLDPRHRLWYDRPEAQPPEGFSVKKFQKKQDQRAKARKVNNGSLERQINQRSGGDEAKDQGEQNVGEVGENGVVAASDVLSCSGGVNGVDQTDHVASDGCTQQRVVKDEPEAVPSKPASDLV